jgi:hypothetical protein
MVLEVVNNGIQEPLEVRVGLTVVAVWCLGMVHPSHLFYNTYFTTVKDFGQFGKGARDQPQKK